jgi:hypothetical protein
MSPSLTAALGYHAGDRKVESDELVRTAWMYHTVGFFKRNP